MNEEMNVMEEVTNMEAAVEAYENFNVADADDGKGGLVKVFVVGSLVVAGAVAAWYCKNKDKIEAKKDERAMKRLARRGYEIYKSDVVTDDENSEEENSEG